jgi:Restriction endonuclease
MSDPRKWKHFERLVTAIHAAADRGAIVRWDESINGRQFDVTVRFKQGLYDYLTVVECKDFTKPVPVEKVEAFVTKSRDAGAHHAVLASSSGFQEGARHVARSHNITLLHVSASDEVDLSAFAAQWAGETEVLHVRSISLEYTDGEIRCLPQEAHALRYYVNGISLACSREAQERISLQDLVQQNSIRFLDNPSGVYQDFSIACPANFLVISPDDGEIPLKELAHIHIQAGKDKARIVAGPVIFDPYLLTPDLKVTNVASGEERIFSQRGLELGFDTVLEQGKFYENPYLAIFYYCERIEANTVTWCIVESYQLGKLLQGYFPQDLTCARYYVEVTDRGTLLRLRRRLDRLKLSGHDS